MSSKNKKNRGNNNSITNKKVNNSKKTTRLTKRRMLEKEKKRLRFIENVILLVFVLMVVLIYIMIPKIYLNGKEVITLNYNEIYNDLGVNASFLGKNITDKIKISGSVNTEKIGNYKINYTLKWFFFDITKTRVIKVVDNKKPVIELVGNKTLNICSDSKYEESGYTATDEYDGDLTKKVKIIEKKDKIIYEVKDSSNNKVKVERKVNREDTEEPVITLMGSSNYYHQLNTAFKEPGYTVSDNCDKDLESKVVVDGCVDVNKEGKYELVYTVVDSNNNKAKVVRTVYVSEKVDANSGITKKGVIYLTFDDGPNKETTSKILDVLKKENVKATFFVTNNGPDSLIKREYDEGHTIALHTASHNYEKIYSSVDSYFTDLKEVSDRVKKITGEETKIIRFPGGSNNTVSSKYSKGVMTLLTNEALIRGYRYYDWNVDAGDAWECAKNSVSNKSKCVYDNVVNNLSKNKANIVLMHDVKKHTAEALIDIIHYGKENGYTFEAITSDTAMIRFKVNN